MKAVLHCKDVSVYQFTINCIYKNTRMLAHTCNYMMLFIVKILLLYQHIILLGQINIVYAGFSFFNILKFYMQVIMPINDIYFLLESTNASRSAESTAPDIKQDVKAYVNS